MKLSWNEGGGRGEGRLREELLLLMHVHVLTRFNKLLYDTWVNKVIIIIIIIIFCGIHVN